jgi:transcription-repair coupling factor (superfamily II helicase)
LSPKHPAIDLAKVLSRPATTLAGVPTGFDGKVIADLLRLGMGQGIGRLAVLARDGNRLS